MADCRRHDKSCMILNSGLLIKGFVLLQRTVICGEIKVGFNMIGGTDSRPMLHVFGTLGAVLDLCVCIFVCFMCVPEFIIIFFVLRDVYKDTLTRENRYANRQINTHTHTTNILPSTQRTDRHLNKHRQY